MKRVKLRLKAVKCLNERSGVVDMAQRLTHGLFCSQLKLSAQLQRSLGLRGDCNQFQEAHRSGAEGAEDAQRMIFSGHYQLRVAWQRILLPKPFLKRFVLAREFVGVD
jgi:hypothetical protein